MMEEAKEKKKRGKVIGYAGEPMPKDSSKIELITLLNYYANNFDSEKSKAFLLKSPDFKEFADIDAQYFKNYGFLYRILTNGYEDKSGLIAKHLDKAKSEFQRIRDTNQIQKQVKQDNRKSWRIKKDQELREIGSLAEQLVDNIFRNRNLGFDSIKDEFLAITSREGIQSILDAARRILRRMESEISEKDSIQQYKRGFLNKCRGQMLLLIEKCQERQKMLLKSAPDITRKTRKVSSGKKKPVNKLKKVSKVKFQQHHVILGDSRGAVTLIGAHEYFVYDGKNLRYYVSEPDKKLDVTGTSIINFDPEKSCMKVIRKVDYIRDIMNITKTAKKKLFDEIKAIKKPVTGRLNDECFLIYV